MAAIAVATRFPAIGAIFGPSLRGGRLRRLLEAQAVLDLSLMVTRTGRARLLIASSAVTLHLLDVRYHHERAGG